ncbi:MAG: phytanoyl-CoA dioxygenase family protein [Proteobacteria bacterium]|nr:phytanoyl-CoA dioxygenase family protein [Pseudomonadota bacterium]
MTAEQKSTGVHTNPIQELVHGNGYTVLKGVISRQEAGAVREEVLGRLAEGTRAGDGVIRVGSILEWGERFERLATNPTLLCVAHELLGEDATLGAFSARVLMPGCEMGGLHIDFPYWAMNAGMPVEPALMLQVIWMMEPFTEVNGGTWVAPGSQKFSGVPELARFAGNALQATGDAGDAVLSHGLLWHRTALNQSDQPRVAILINYTQLTVRPMVPWNLSDEFISRISPQMRSLLSLDYALALKKRVTTHAG